MCSEEGLAGWCFTLFLSRDAQGKPVATADWSQWCDVSSGNRGPQPVVDGVLDLRSDAWGSGQPILGRVRFAEGGEDDTFGGALWFQMGDPFVALGGK